MKTSLQTDPRAISLKFVMAAILLGMLLASPQLMAQSVHPMSDSRMCILLGMLGSTLPPHCVDDNGDNGELSDEVLAKLDQLRLATVAFYNFDVAMAAGWNAQLSECVESPMGGMGYHFGNPSQLDNGGQLSLFRPEVLLFAPMEDGSMEFVAVEWLLHPDYWPHEDPPQFLEQDMIFNGHLGLWTLHAWVAKHNPEGVFFDWNPDVNCEHAPELNE